MPGFSFTPPILTFITHTLYILTNSMAYGTRRFNAAFTLLLIMLSYLQVHITLQCGAKIENETCIVLYCIVLMGWSMLSNALRSFKIYCAPPDLGIRT